ncbi:hypothetical protein QEG98_08400 [Myxococcus sp. MxC21-1]|nr:hypothetical protein [Myxococcus sp. MxC21-1]WNZ63708.1 hypothetical protein QEG98_08400 [Myxococcus sp. MxC21-1]
MGSDGTVSRTRRVEDIRPGAEGSAPAFQGAKLFQDLVRGSGGLPPAGVTAIQGWLFFGAAIWGGARSRTLAE